MGAEMSDALRKAFEIAGRLPKREQDELAAAILEELASDKCWDAALGHSILRVLGAAFVLSRSSRESLSSVSGLAHSGNLRTVSDIPALVAFHYRRKLVSHALFCLHDHGGFEHSCQSREDRGYSALR